MMKRFFACLAVVWGGVCCGGPGGLPLPAEAQTPSRPALRAELPVAAENDVPFTVLPAGRLGVFVLMRQNDLFSNRPKRDVCFYDENLDLRWISSLVMESTYSYMGYRLERDSLRLYLTTVPEKSPYPAFLEVAVCLYDGGYSKYYHEADVSSLHKGSVESFTAVGDSWHFLVKAKDVYKYGRYYASRDSLSLEDAASVHGYECLDVQWDTAFGNACFLFRDVKLDEKDLYLQVASMDGSRSIEHVTVNAPQSDMRLIDARMAVGGAGELILAGTWNSTSSRQHISAFDRGSETAGVFAAYYKNNFRSNFWARPYLEFEGIDSLLSGEEAYKLAAARNKAGGRPIMPDYLASLRMWKADGGFHLIAETYDRQLTTVTDVTYDFYGRMVPYTHTRFDGYLFKNAFYVEWDSTAMAVGSSVFNIQHLSYENRVEPIVAYMRDTSSGGFLYAYARQGTVFFRGLNDRGGFSAVKSFKIANTMPGDKVQKTWGEAVIAWYPGALLAYGHQQVINSRRKGKSRQNIFYLNKIVVE